MISGSKGRKSDASLLAGGFLNLGPAKNMSKEPFFEEKFDYTPIFCSMDHHVSSREIGLLYRDSSSLSPAARQFIQTAREVIPSFVRSEIPHFEVREDINFS